MIVYRDYTVRLIFVAFTFFGVLCIPASAEDWIYEVQPGDNLWSLSEKYLINSSYWKRLQLLNQVKDPWHVPPGTELRIPTRWLYKHPIMAQVLNIQGKAYIKENGQGDAKLLSIGSLLIGGDSVNTGADANVTIKFIDGSKLLLQPNSQLTLDHLTLYGSTGMTDTRIKLDRGRMETQVAPKKGPASRFEISTPAAVTSVRGTDYRLSADNEVRESRVESLEGRIKVSSAGQAKLISKGYGTIAGENTPPLPPIPLLEPPKIASIPRIFDSVPIQFEVPTVPNVHSRRIQIAVDRTFDKVLFDGYFTTGMIRGPDLPDGNYYLRVRNIDARKLEGLNSQLVFTLNARPEAPFPIHPKPESWVTPKRPEFKWSRQVSDHQYHFQIARNVDFLHPVIDLPKYPEAELILDKELELGIYFWRVATIDDAEGHGPFSNPEQFRRIALPPQTEEPEIDDESILIRWKKGLIGQKYQFQLSRNISFEQPIVDRLVNKPQVQISRPEAGDYFMRVRNIDPDGFIGPFGKPQILNVPQEGLYWWLLLALPLIALIAL